MKYLSLVFLFMMSCAPKKNMDQQKIQITSVIDNWHNAAAEANFDAYFSAMANESIFIGTDASENWSKKEFQDFAKPYFDKGKAWNFKAIQRNIYFSDNRQTVWFDELLSTQMKICRGSGVIVIENGEWKIKHYVLSMTIPNENVDEVVKIKTKLEDLLLDKIGF